MLRLWYMVLIFFSCKTRNSRIGPIHWKGSGDFLIGNTSHLPSLLSNPTVRLIRATMTKVSSSTLHASVTVSISDTSFNDFIQSLLSEVIKQLLPLDIVMSLPKTVEAVHELLKGRDDPNLSGLAKSNIDESDVLKMIQSMKHLDIAKISILPTFMKFSSGDKVHLSLPVEIGIDGESTKASVFNSLAKVKIDVVCKLLWDASKDQIFIIEASRIIINDIQIRKQKSMTDPSEKDMQSVLWTILIDVINNCIQLVADILNASLLSTLASPTGTFGTIKYHLISSPKVTDRYFLIPYQATFQVPLLGDPPSATTFQVSPKPGTKFQLALSKDFISDGIAALTGGSSAAFTTGAGQKPLMTTDLTSVIPKISGHFPTPHPLVVEIRGSNFPLVSMDSPSITVKQVLFTEVLTHGKSVLHLEVKMVFKAKCSASNDKLFISLSQSSIDVIRASSPVGSSNAQKLHEWINSIYMNSFLPAMNGLLSEGITLPSVLNVKWTKVNVALSQASKGYCNPQMKIHDPVGFMTHRLKNIAVIIDTGFVVASHTWIEMNIGDMPKQSHYVLTNAHASTQPSCLVLAFDHPQKCSLASACQEDILTFPHQECCWLAVNRLFGLFGVDNEILHIRAK